MHMFSQREDGLPVRFFACLFHLTVPGVSHDWFWWHSISSNQPFIWESFIITLFLEQVLIKKSAWTFLTWVIGESKCYKFIWKNRNYAYFMKWCRTQWNMFYNYTVFNYLPFSLLKNLIVNSLPLASKGGLYSPSFEGQPDCLMGSIWHGW